MACWAAVPPPLAALFFGTEFLINQSYSVLLTGGQLQKSNLKMKFSKKLETVESQVRIKNMKKDECPASKNVVPNLKNLQKIKKMKKKKDSNGSKEDDKKGLSVFRSTI